MESNAIKKLKVLLDDADVRDEDIEDMCDAIIDYLGEHHVLLLLLDRKAFQDQYLSYFDEDEIVEYVLENDLVKIDNVLPQTSCIYLEFKNEGSRSNIIDVLNENDLSFVEI